MCSRLAFAADQETARGSKNKYPRIVTGSSCKIDCALAFWELLLSRLSIVLLETRLARLNTWSLPNQKFRKLAKPANWKRAPSSGSAGMSRSNSLTQNQSFDFSMMVFCSSKKLAHSLFFSSVLSALYLFCDPQRSLGRLTQDTHGYTAMDLEALDLQHPNSSCICELPRFRKFF